MIIKRTETMGRGVFAERYYACGEALGEFHTLPLSVADYAYEGAGGPALVLGWPSLLNHSGTPNVDREFYTTTQGEMAIFFATRKIAAGEQLFIDYHRAAAWERAA
jgi:hypothetical protein